MVKVNLQGGPKSRLHFGMWCVQCNPRLTSYVCYLTPLRTRYCPQIRNVAYTSYIPTKDSKVVLDTTQIL